jgi:hypothetical protein
MANRTGTYFAFDGLGQTDPAKSDFKYYATVQAWSAGKHTEFKYVDSHEKTNAVRDTSKRATLEARIRERLAASKNVVVIISGDTRKSGSMLSYEIEKAVDTYQLPLIIAYTGYNSILNPSSHSDRWPNALAKRINNRTVKAIHIPYKKDAILDAIGQFTVNGKQPNGGSLGYYNRQTQVGWGYIQ